MNIKGCSPSCSQLLATSWIIPCRDNMEHTLVRLKGIFLVSPHLGRILWIFTVILCPALSSRDLILYLCGSLSSREALASKAELVLPAAGIPALPKGTGDSWVSSKWKRDSEWMQNRRMMKERKMVRAEKRVKPRKCSWFQMHLSFLRKFILGAAPEGSAGKWCYLV